MKENKQESGVQWIAIIVVLIAIGFYLVNFTTPSKWEKQGRKDFDTASYNRKYPQHYTKRQIEDGEDQ